MLRTQEMRLSATQQIDEWTAWQRLADAIGYSLMSTGRRQGETAWLATMQRPDGSLAQIEMDQTELRRILECLP